MKKYNLIFLTTMIGFMQFAKAQTIDTSCINVMSDFESNSVLKVFPNPTDGTIQIEYGSNSTCPPAGWGGILIINVINSKAETVYTETIEDFEGEYSNTVDLSKQEKGIYMVEIAAGKLKMWRRLLLK